MFPLHPPVQETVVKAVKTLQSHGHEVIPITVDQCRISELNEIAYGLFSLDKTGFGILSTGGEPLIPSAEHITSEVKSFKWEFMSSLSGLDDLEKFAKLQARRAELSEDWRKIWYKYKFDAVIAPSAQSTAVEHDTFGWPPYTAFLNVLNVSNLDMS